MMINQYIKTINVLKNNIYNGICYRINIYVDL